MATYDPLTALIVVDVQNDFADPNGALSVPGGEAVVRATNAEIQAARQAGALIAYTTDYHPAHTPHFAQDGGIWPVHCVAGTWGAELHPDLDVGPDPVLIRKGEGQDDGYSGMNVRAADGTIRPTALPAVLEQRGIRRVVVVGLATDYCVKATALDTLAAGYPTVVPTGAIAAVNLKPEDGASAIAELATAGATLDAEPTLDAESAR